MSIEFFCCSIIHFHTYEISYTRIPSFSSTVPILSSSFPYPTLGFGFRHGEIRRRWKIGRGPRSRRLSKEAPRILDRSRSTMRLKGSIDWVRSKMGYIDTHYQKLTEKGRRFIIPKIYFKTFFFLFPFYPFSSLINWRKFIIYQNTLDDFQNNQEFLNN